MDPNPHRTKDLEYGYPSSERGISFSDRPGLSFLEILRYSGCEGDANDTEDADEEVRVKQGTFDNVNDLVAWIKKVSFTSIYLISVLEFV